jgi:hypothetical protein
VGTLRTEKPVREISRSNHNDRNEIETIEEVLDSLVLFDTEQEHNDDIIADETELAELDESRTYQMELDHLRTYPRVLNEPVFINMFRITLRYLRAFSERFDDKAQKSDIEGHFIRWMK